MTSSLCRDSVVQRSSPISPELPCIAALIDLLDRALRETETSEAIFFPSHVVEALLSINSCIESRQLVRVASLLDGYKEQLLQVLHTNSWHFLACIFLKSDSAADQERALQILQDTKWTPLDTAANESKTNSLSSFSAARLVEESLATTLYEKFIDNTENIGSRILAGKSLLETLQRSNNEVELLLQDELPAMISHGINIPLTFFSGALMRLLYLSGADEESLWPHDDAARRQIFFQSLQMFPNDWTQSFHYYCREIDKALRIDSHKVYLVRSVTFGTISYIADHILAILTPEALVFIPPVGEAALQFFYYIEIPLHHILHIETRPTRIAEREVVWELQLSREGFFLANGKKQQLDGSSLIISSAYDLAELLKQIETTNFVGIKTKGRKCSGAIVALVAGNLEAPNPSFMRSFACDNAARGPATVKARRVSSSFVSLDSGEEVAAKSMQYEEDILETRNRSASGKTRDYPEANWENPGSIGFVDSGPSNLAEGSHTLLVKLSVPNSVLLQIEQNSITQSPSLIRQSWDEQQEVEEGNESLPGEENEACHGVDGTLPTASSQPEDSHPSTSINAMHPSAADPIITDSQKKTEELAHMDNTAGDKNHSSSAISSPQAESTTNADKATLPKRKTSTKAEQIPIPKNTRSRTSNTQYSLLFPRPRRSKRKVYKAQKPKATVDWDEALRPSDDEEAPDTQNSLGLTSVTSPSSNVTDRGINFSGKKKARPRASNARESTGQNRRKANPKKANRESPPALRTRRKSANKKNWEPASPQKNTSDQVDTAADVDKLDPISGTEASEPADKSKSLIVILRYSSVLVKQREDAGRHVTTSNDTHVSRLESGQTEVAPEETKLDRTESMSSTNDFVFLSQIENLPGAFDDHLRSDADESKDKSKSNDGGRCPETQKGRGQFLGNKLAAALLDDDSCPQQNAVTLVDENVSSPNIIQDPTKPSESEQPPTAINRQRVSHQASAESLEEPEVIPVSPVYDKTRLGYQTGHISPAGEDSVMKDLKHDFAAANPPAQATVDSPGPCLDITASAQVSKHATSIRKRALSQDSAEEPIAKKPRTVSFAAPGSRKDQSLPAASPQNQECHGIASDGLGEQGKQVGALEKPSWNMEKECYFNSRKALPGLPDTGNRPCAGASHASEHKGAPSAPKEIRRPLPKPTIVDVNGSPRPTSRVVSYLGMAKLEDSGHNQRTDERPGELENPFDDGDVSDEYDSDVDVYIEKSLNSGRKKTVSRDSFSFAERLRDCAIDKANSPKSGPAPEMRSLEASPAKSVAGPKHERQADSDSEIQQNSPTVNRPHSVDLNSDYTDSTTLIERDDNQAGPGEPPRTVSNELHDMLISTGKLLMRHLDDEKDSITRVLEAYRKGCDGALDRLFAAQEERVELHRQQMAAVQKHHSDLSRDLIHRLKENDKRIQQRLSFPMLERGLKERKKLESRVSEMLRRHNNAFQDEGVSRGNR